MKDQYVGDYNDFVKYALLRTLLAEGLPLLLCWMLTGSDGSSDGGKLAYLHRPSTFRPLDPTTFDALARLVGAGERRIASIESSGLLAGCRFYARPLEDDSSSRSTFFHELWAAPTAVLFFDPDNGFEVPSAPRGRRGSAKYVYWSEVGEAYGRGHSVIVFQHFAREKRARHIARLLGRLAEVSTVEPFALRSANVGFFVAAQPEHEEGLDRVGLDLAGRWGPRLLLERLQRRTG